MEDEYDSQSFEEDNLVEDLRAFGEANKSLRIGELMLMAADEIVRLRLDIELLRDDMRWSE